MLTSFGKLTELTGKHSWVDSSAWVLIQTRTPPELCGWADVYKCRRKSPLHRDGAINRRCFIKAKSQLGLIKEGNATMLQITSLVETFAADEVQQ